MTWGHGDLEHPQAQYFLAKTMCAFALMYIYISLKSKNHTESSILKKKRSLPIALPKIYMCIFFFVIIVNWMIIFLTKVPLNIWRLTHCPFDDVALILCV